MVQIPPNHGFFGRIRAGISRIDDLFHRIGFISVVDRIDCYCNPSNQGVQCFVFEFNRFMVFDCHNIYIVKVSIKATGGIA